MFKKTRHEEKNNMTYKYILHYQAIEKLEEIQNLKDTTAYYQVHSFIPSRPSRNRRCIWHSQHEYIIQNVKHVIVQHHEIISYYIYFNTTFLVLRQG